MACIIASDDGIQRRSWQRQDVVQSDEAPTVHVLRRARARGKRTRAMHHRRDEMAKDVYMFIYVCVCVLCVRVVCCVLCCVMFMFMFMFFCVFVLCSCCVYVCVCVCCVCVLCLSVVLCLCSCSCPRACSYMCVCVLCVVCCLFPFKSQVLSPSPKTTKKRKDSELT